MTIASGEVKEAAFSIKDIHNRKNMVSGSADHLLGLGGGNETSAHHVSPTEWREKTLQTEQNTEPPASSPVPRF